MIDRPDDDAWRLRLLEAARPGPRDRGTTPGAACLVVRTTAAKAYPAAAQRFYACTPLVVLGAEVEGGPGILTPAPSTFLALNLGSAVPPSGTNLLVTFVDGRWVFRYDG